MHLYIVIKSKLASWGPFVFFSSRNDWLKSLTISYSVT